MFDLIVTLLIFFSDYDISKMFDLTVTWLIFSFQAMRIPGPTDPGPAADNTGTTPPGPLRGCIFYTIHMSQSGPSLMSGGPVVISQTGQQVPQPGSMIISHPSQHTSQEHLMVVSQTNPHPQAMTGNLAFHVRFP